MLAIEDKPLQFRQSHLPPKKKERQTEVIAKELLVHDKHRIQGQKEQQSQQTHRKMQPKISLSKKMGKKKKR